MTSTVNMLSTEYPNFTSEIKNKGFLILDEMFKLHGWHKSKNEMNWIIYTKAGFETEFFEIKVDQTMICVCVPLKNSIFQYTTSFKDYFTASEYIENRFKDLIE